MKNYSFWIKATITMQILTCIFHILGIIAETTPKNESEKILLELMHDYKFDLGAGFRHSMADIMLAFSISFSLLLFFSAAINFFLLKYCFDVKILKGVIGINIFIYLFCFITMALLTFLPPVICIALILLFLSISYFKLVK